MAFSPAPSYRIQPVGVQRPGTPSGSGGGRSERDEMRHDLGGEQGDRCRRLCLAHVAERKPADEVGTPARGDLSLDLLAHAGRRARDGDAALERLGEIPGEAERESGGVETRLRGIRITHNVV